MNDWDDIRYFLAVARHGNVTAAAKAMRVNHSTVSRRIQSMEEKNGVRLFERNPMGYEMTTAASGIFDLAIELETKHQHVSRQLFAQDSRLEGEINITMPHDILEYCLVDKIAEFRRQNPAIILNVSVGQGLKNMAAREADVAIRLTPSPPDYLIGRKVATLQHGIYTNSDYTHDEIMPLIIWSGEVSVPDWAENCFLSSEIVMRVDDLYSMYSAVKAGIGVARMPCYLADSLLDKNIRRLTADIPASTWGVWVLSHVDLRHTARVRTCREYLVQELLSKKDLFEGEKSIYLSTDG